MICAMLPFTAILWNADIIFGWAGQDEENSKLALEYTQLMAVSVLLMGTFDLLKRFFIAMGLAIAPLVIQVAGLLIQCGLNYLFVQKIQLKGLAVSLIISSCLMSLCAFFYIFSLRFLNAKNYFTRSFFR